MRFRNKTTLGNNLTWIPSKKKIWDDKRRHDDITFFALKNLSLITLFFTHTLWKKNSLDSIKIILLASFRKYCLIDWDRDRCWFHLLFFTMTWFIASKKLNTILQTTLRTSKLIQTTQIRSHHPDPFNPKTTRGWKAALKVRFFFLFKKPNELHAHV